MASKNGGGFLFGALIGAALGVVGGVLFAPKKGEETRKDLKAKLDELNNQPGGLVGNLQEKSKEVADQVREFGQNLKSQADQKVQQFTGKLDNQSENSNSTAQDLGEKKRRFFKGV